MDKCARVPKFITELLLILLTPHLRSTGKEMCFVSDGGIQLIELDEHTKLESTVRYLGIEVEDALELSEQTEI